LPWVIGLGILAAIVARLPFSSFVRAIEHGSHVQLGALNLAFNVAVVFTESVATWIGLEVLHMRRPFASVVAVRGATYALSMVNYAVGQGGFGYYLKRSGEPPLRAAGATLFLIGTNLAMLLVVTVAAWAVHGDQTGVPAMWWTLLACTFGFLVYLVVIALRPAPLARRQLLAPLFDAGVRGHSVAMLSRLPHVVVVVIGQWAALRVWGIEVPFTVGMALMPAVVIASVLPISPAGLGTMQAALVLFFSDYAAGSTADERAATVAAFAIVHLVYRVLSSLVVGFASLPSARRASASEGVPG
jgi:hypothetical protein